MGLFESKKAKEARLRSDSSYREGFSAGEHNNAGYDEIWFGDYSYDDTPPPEGAISVGYIRKWKTDTSFTYEVRLSIGERARTKDIGFTHDIEAYARGLRDGYAKYRTNKLAKIAARKRGNAKNAGEGWNTV